MCLLYTVFKDSPENIEKEIHGLSCDVSKLLPSGFMKKKVSLFLITMVTLVQQGL